MGGSRRTRRWKLASMRAGGRQPPRQLEQSQRVAARFGESPVAHTRVHGSAEDRREQPSRRAVGQAGQPQLGQPRQLLHDARLALREQEEDRLRRQAPRHEREHLRR